MKPSRQRYVASVQPDQLPEVRAAVQARAELLRVQQIADAAVAAAVAALADRGLSSREMSSLLGLSHTWLHRIRKACGGSP